MQEDTNFRDTVSRIWHKIRNCIRRYSGHPRLKCMWGEIMIFHERFASKPKEVGFVKMIISISFLCKGKCLWNKVSHFQKFICLSEPSLSPGIHLVLVKIQFFHPHLPRRKHRSPWASFSRLSYQIWRMALPTSRPFSILLPIWRSDWIKLFHINVVWARSFVL